MGACGTKVAPVETKVFSRDNFTKPPPTARSRSHNIYFAEPIAITVSCEKCVNLPGAVLQNCPHTIPRSAIVMNTIPDEI